MDNETETARILRQSHAGDGAASDRLLDLVYDELRRIAASYIRRERPDHTLQATALVHEAWLNLVEGSAVDWQDRTHFLSMAACVMRRVLVDRARKKSTKKRGGDRQRLPLQDALSLSVNADVDFLDLDEALARLAAKDERKARVVELRFFGGLTCDEVAQSLNISPKTVEADWFMARAWLHRQLSTEEKP